MTDQTLTKERNFFLAGFFALVAIGAVFRLGALSEPPDAVENVQRLGAVLTLLAKLVFVYLVFRLSRFLRQPVWLTITYCVLTPFSLLYLIPFIGLLIGVKNARRALPSSAAAGTNPEAQREPPATSMKTLQGLFGLLYGAAFVGNGILVLYVEWSYLRQSFLQVFNPLLHLQVLLTLLTMPLFWVLLVVTVLGYFAMAGVQKHIDEGL